MWILPFVAILVSDMADTYWECGNNTRKHSYQIRFVQSQNENENTNYHQIRTFVPKHKSIFISIVNISYSRTK